MFVLDASVTLAWCFTDETSTYADGVLARLEQEEAIAPAIWPLEVANGLLNAERRRRLNAGDIPRVRELLAALPVGIEMTELEAALGGVLELAKSPALSAYDAAYLALAARRGLPLATIDVGLRQACERAGVSLVP